MAAPSSLHENRFGLRFHHLGLAVRAPDDARSFLGALGYAPAGEVYDPLQKVKLELHRHETMPNVELIWPSQEKSPIDNLLAHRTGLVYHMCYVAADPAASIAAMEAAGLNALTVSPPQPAVLFGGRNVSFHVIADVGLIEIIECPDHISC